VTKYILATKENSVYLCQNYIID